MKNWNEASEEEILALSIDEQKKLLLHDPFYYGHFGQTVGLSNSVLSRMLDDPMMENEKNWGNGSALVIGKYVHQYFLEPEKFKDFLVLDFDNRHKKGYKEAVAASDERWLLLRKDAEKWTDVCEKAMARPEIHKMFREDDVEFEVPLIGTLNGLRIKGKADCVNHTEKLIIDIKTSSDANGFNLPSEYDQESKTKAHSFNYDAQAWLYSYLYPGYGFRFVAIDKRELDVQVYDSSLWFLASGRHKIYEAIEIYKRYWNSDPIKTPFKMLY